MGAETMDSHGGRKVRRRATSEARAKRRHARRSSGQTGAKRWSGRLWVVWVAGILLIAIVAVLVLITRDSNVLAGEIVAEYTEYDFGEVPIDGGLISAQFPLQAVDPATITRIEST
jgi:hypothetical protein